jgi:fumarate hydratase subunit beta
MERDLGLPIDERTARELRVGDILWVTGRLFTARDEAHRLMLGRYANGEPLPFAPSEMALFHCGPIVRKSEKGWDAVSAGPTTSARMEPFEDRFLAAFSPRIVIGKGGMGDKTQAALQEVGAIYAHYPGGAGALAAKKITGVAGVHWLDELGMPESVWIFDVQQFGPLLVTMDSIGGSFYRELDNSIAENVRAILVQIERGSADHAGRKEITG